jgi:tape measure domain-containing protein
MAVDILNLGFKVDTSQVKNASRDLDGLSLSAKKTNDSLTGMSASSKKTSADTVSLTDSVGRLAAAYIGLQTAKAIIGIADDYTKLTSQLKLATRSQTEFSDAFNNVKQISSTAQAGLSETAVLYARISNATRELGANQTTVAAITESIALGLKVSGATASEASSAMLQLSQAFGSGVLRGEEFNAVNEAAPRLMKALADGMGVPIGKLRNLASEGKITSDILGNALVKSLEQVRTEAEQMNTVGGAFVVLKNNILLTAGSLDKASGASAAFASAIKSFADSGVIKIVFETIAVLGVNVAFVFQTLGREIGGFAAQLEAVSRLDFKGAIAIGDQVGKDAEAARIEVDKLTESILNPKIGNVSIKSEIKELTKASSDLTDEQKAKAKQIEKENRDLLTSIRELVEGERTNIQVLQDKLDFNDKITPSNRKLAQSNLDLAKSIAFAKSEMEAFDKGLENEAELFNESLDVAQKYTEQMESNYTSMSDEITKENEDLNARLITNDRDRAVEQLRIEHERKTKMIQMSTEQGDAQDDLLAREMENYRLRNQELQLSQSLVKDLGLTFSSAFEDAVVAGNKLSDVLQSLLQDILKLVTRQLITNPLMGAIGGALQNILPASMGGYTALPDTSANYFSASANGNVMTPNGPAKLNTYANGGIATSPQVSLFGEGRMNEAYVPLPDGRSIPVSMKGGGSNVQVVVNNNTPAQATTNETIDSRGNRRIEVTISEMVAGEIKRNGSIANSAIKNTFNTQPVLIGR